MLSLCRPTNGPPEFRRLLSSAPLPHPPWRTVRPRCSKPKLILRVSTPNSNPNPNPNPVPFSSLLKPACIAIATAAVAFTAASASFLTLHHRPPLAYVTEYISDGMKERSLESRIASDPDDAWSLRELMELKIKSRKLCDAISIADRLITLQPGDLDAPLLKAYLHNYAGDTKASKFVFEEVLNADPYVVEAYHGLVAIALQPDSGSNSELRSILNRVDKAMEKCREEHRKVELRDFKLLVAMVNVIEGNLEDALEIHEDLVAEEPGDFRPYLCRGIIYTLMKKEKKAVKEFDKHRQLMPKGHPYGRYFEEIMRAMVALSQMAANKKEAVAK